MILHIIPDDKFVMNFCETARAVAPSNVNQLFLVRSALPFKHLSGVADYLIPAPVFSDEFNRIVAQMGKGDRILIHFLSTDVREWLAHFETAANIEWVFWSADFYGNMVYDYPQYDPLTYLAIKKPAEKLSRFWALHQYRKFLATVSEKKEKHKYYNERNAAAKKITRLHHYIKEEYELIVRTLPMKASFNMFCYSQDMSFDSIVNSASEEGTKELDKLALMFGHSGYPHANHVDMFEMLKDKMEGIEILAPLAYGNPDYIAQVIEAGVHTFGKQFKPLTDYMSFEDYLQQIKQCYGFLLGTNMPKGMGNVHTFICLGKRVFVKRNMLVNDYFQRIGVQVDTIETFSKKLLTTPVPEKTRALNIDRLLQIHSEEKQTSYVYNMLTLST